MASWSICRDINEWTLDSTKPQECNTFWRNKIKEDPANWVLIK
jgi:hypothetical protein